MDIAIRNGRPEDYDAFVRLFADLEIPDPVPSASAFAQSIVPLMRVATLGDAVVGFTTWRAYGPLVHVMQVAVDAAVRGKRVGQRLLEHVRDEARAAGATRWYLNVKRDNAPAIRLYERVGMTFELEMFAMKLAWANVPDIAVDERIATPDDDAEIEARFNVPADRVASFRARGHFRLVTLRDATDALLGFAAFDPSFPGAATFAATRPDLAASLLAAMRHHASPAFDFVRVAVEGDRPLADAVMALGAEMVFEILRLGAKL